MERLRASVIHVAAYGAAYPGTFVASLRALQRPCSGMGLSLAFAFSDCVASHGWVADLRREGFPVHILRAAESLGARTRALAEIVARERAVLIHTHFGTYDVPAALAALRSRGRVAVVWHAHNALSERRPVLSVAKDLAKLSVLGRGARLVAVSPAIIDEAARHGFPRGRAWHVPNGIDLAHATRTRLGRDELRRQLGIASSASVVLAFGWDPERKGIDLALRALGAMSARGAAAVLVAVGTERLRSFVHAALGRALPAWLRVVEPREDVADLFAAADVFLSASREEGFSYALGEALANGLPVVCSDIPGIRWACRAPGVQLFTPGDAVSLVQALIAVSRRSRADREAFALGARRFAAEQLSLAVWADRMGSMYRAVLGESASVAIPRTEDKLEAMLLNEVQKLARLHAAGQAKIAELQSEIAEHRKQAQEQKATMKRLLDEVSVIQATLASGSALGHAAARADNVNHVVSPVQARNIDSSHNPIVDEYDEVDREEARHDDRDRHLHHPSGIPPLVSRLPTQR